MLGLALLPPNLQRIGRRAATGISGSWKPSLLTMLTLAAGASAVANAVASTAPFTAAPEAPTRLGTAIEQNLHDRDSAIADQKRALDLREQAQRAAERRLQNDLQADQGGASPTPAGPNPADSQNGMYDALARIYQTMKPTKAAPIFEKLDPEVQLQVAKRMRDRSTALLLAAMSPDAAAELSMSLAGRHVVKAAPSPSPRPVASMRSDASAPTLRHREAREARDTTETPRTSRRHASPGRETAKREEKKPAVVAEAEEAAPPALLAPAAPVLAAK